MNGSQKFPIAEKFHTVRQRMARLSEKTGIPNSEFCLMRVISSEDGNEGISVSEIAARLEVTPPAVSRSLRSLEERGLIERRVNVLNRRCTRVELTEKGRELLKNADEKFLDMMEYVGEKLGKERLQEFDGLFEELLKAMLEYMNKEENDI